MRFFASTSRIALSLAAAGMVLTLAAAPLMAQTTAQTTAQTETPTQTSESTPSQTVTAQPTTPDATSTVGSVASELPAPAPARAWHDTVVPADKQITAKVTDGMLIVDGLVAKVQLNYDINHANYLYFYVPGVGTAIVSRVEVYGATKVKEAFNGSRLTFSTGGHTFELTSRSALVGKSDAYVMLDTETVALDRFPMVGFGSTTRAPYVWPLSGTSAKDSYAHLVTPPPMPTSVLPRTANTKAIQPQKAELNQQ